MSEKFWFEADNINEYDSPALLIYPVRIKENIKKLLEKVSPELLRPHVKTNKIAEVSQMLLNGGIKKFKAATIAESEMLGMIKAPNVLLAYPATTPKIKRLIRLIRKYPDTAFSCLVDHMAAAKAMAEMFAAANLVADVYIDLNIGMNRTGIKPEQAMSFFKEINSLPAIHVLGLHVYDGHIKDLDIITRTDNCHRQFEPVLLLKSELERITNRSMILIAGGSPTCFIHGEAGSRECSPGTFVFWDKGYSENLPEQPFDWASVLFCRVISIPADDMICVDLGYKSVASENPLPRVYFLNAPEAIPFSHSEEHLVLKVPNSAAFFPGDVLYGIPWHICPTVALYDQVLVIEDGRIVDTWNVIARKREITI